MQSFFCSFYGWNHLETFSTFHVINVEIVKTQNTQWNVVESFRIMSPPKTDHLAIPDFITLHIGKIFKNQNIIQ